MLNEIHQSLNLGRINQVSRLLNQKKQKLSGGDKTIIALRSELYQGNYGKVISIASNALDESSLQPAGEIVVLTNNLFQHETLPSLFAFYC